MMRFLAIGGLLLACHPAHAQRMSKVTGATLMSACTGKSTSSCDAYLDGFSDAIFVEGKTAAVACVPIPATGTEMREVLIQYMKGHPEVQHMKAGEIAHAALAKAYPCRK